MTEPTTIRIAVILASTRQGRFGPVVARWFMDWLCDQPHVRAELLDLRLFPAGDPSFARRIAEADAVVVVTAEYNHSFPGPLKVAIDSLRHEWITKPIGLVSYGGTSGGLRAVEHLRLVFAELHAVTVRSTVSFAHARTCFDTSGQPHDAGRAHWAASRLLAELLWWEQTVRHGRERAPYPWDAKANETPRSRTEQSLEPAVNVPATPTTERQQ